MITDIHLQHYRSYKDDSFEVSPGVNIIVGPNASGKTNLLEALQVVCIGSSYRSKDSELVEFSKPWARLDAHTQTGQRTVKLERKEDTAVKTFGIDGQVFKRLSLTKSLPLILFEPSHLLLLSGAPELRRTYADNILEQIVPGYSTLRRQYQRTLAQRNALLKRESRGGADQLFAWNIRLSELGGRIAVERQKLVASAAKDIQKLYNKLANTREKVVLAYSSSCSPENYSNQMLRKLEASVEQDYARGFTAHGPHRDDLALSLNGHLAQESASRGEKRTLLLALKIIELKQIEKFRGQKPILLLDDVFSELDGARRRSLTEFLEGYQAFITTTDADVVVHHFTDCNIIPIS